jgi:periplasmic divalent cation tolerance protein
MKSDFFVVLCTAGVDESEKIARLLVDEKLAACVNVAEVNSVFRWKGEFCKDKEALLIIKTEKKKVEGIIERIKEMHSYELPEIIAIPIVMGYDKYLAWMEESIG